MEIGNLIKFGTYRYEKNELKEIEWKILNIENNKIFVVSKYAIDVQPYDTEMIIDFKNGESSSKANWKDSTLRKWLNNEFLISALSIKERECLCEITYKEKNIDLTDRVSLLSINDINSSIYFPTNHSTECESTPYVKENFIDEDEKMARQEGGKYPLNTATSYWLREPFTFVVGVNNISNYVIAYKPDLRTKLAIRPTIIIDINKCEIKDYEDEDYSKYNIIADKKNGFIEEKKFNIRIELHKETEQKIIDTLVNVLAKAINGDAESQVMLGRLLWNGNYVVKDYEQSVRWTKYAVNQGSASAMLDLAEAYFNGIGVEQNSVEGFKLTKKSLNIEESPLGFYFMGLCFLNGEGTFPDKDEAIKYLEKASKMGHEGAKELLGEIKD